MFPTLGHSTKAECLKKTLSKTATLCAAICALCALLLTGCASSPEKENIKTKPEVGAKHSQKLVDDGPSIPMAQDDAKVQLIVANQYYERGQFDHAEKAYLNAIRLDNNQPVAHYRLGNIAFRKGEFQQASVFFETALAQAPRNPKAHYNLAASYLSLADKHFSDFMDLTSPDSPQAERVKQLLSSIQSYARPNKGPTELPKIVPDNKDPLDELADFLE